MLIHTRNGRTIVELGGCSTNGKMKLGGISNSTRPAVAPPRPRPRVQNPDTHPKTVELSVEAIWEKRRVAIEAAIRRNYIEASGGDTTSHRPSRQKTTGLFVDAIYAARKPNR